MHHLSPSADTLLGSYYEYPMHKATTTTVTRLSASLRGLHVRAVRLAETAAQQLAGCQQLATLDQPVPHLLCVLLRNRELQD